MTDFTPRPTVFKGTQMRSRLEAGFAQWLDSVSVEWEYEPCAFADDGGFQYLPDFRVRMPFLGLGTPTIYIEVKPTSDDWHPYLTGRPAEFGLKARRAIKASEPDSLLIFAFPLSAAPFWTIDPRPSRFGPNLLALALLQIDDKPGFGIPYSTSPWAGEWWKGGT